MSNDQQALVNRSPRARSCSKLHVQ